MVSASGNTVIALNGEIYNYQSLRAELASLGYGFRSNSDTEVVLAGFELWGKAVLNKLRGMFAFVIYDKSKNELFMARDHTGIKPLYYTLVKNTIVFASEIKALLKYQGVFPKVNLRRLPQFMSFLWVPAPETLFQDIFILEPAHCLTINGKGLHKEEYWHPDLVAHDQCIKEKDWIDWLDGRMTDIVKEQLMSDVPLGALLSGGVDSSMVVALMNRASSNPVTTYTTGFFKSDLASDVIRSDVEFARLAAKSLKVDYHELILSPDVVNILPKIVWHMDEPVADPAAVTTFLICQAVKPFCTVMLSGVGGDEIFGGYPRYRAGLLAEQYRRFPKPCRNVFESVLMKRSGGTTRWVRNAKKFVKSASLPFLEAYYGYLTYYSHEELRRLLNVSFNWKEIFSLHDLEYIRYESQDKLQGMMNLDLKTFLPNLNLMYTDKMSAASSVEIRVPFLDHLLIEQVARIPARFKVRGFTQKYILKKTAEKMLPKEIVWRQKVGFGAPVGAWLKGQTKEMMLDLLSEKALKKRGYFDPAAISDLIQDHLSGREYNANQLWQLMTLELWHQEYIDKT